MSDRSEALGAAMMAVRAAIDASPRMAGRLPMALDILIEEREADPAARPHTAMTPERAAALLGISSSRMRLFCQRPEVSLRVGGRWLVKPEWVAAELMRRRALGLLPAI